MLAVTHQLEAAKKQLNMVKGEMYPSLALYSGWRTGYYETYTDEEGNTIAFGDQFEQNRQLNYGISLSIPISGLFQSHNRMRQARVHEKQMENRLKTQLNELEYEISEELLNWRAAISEQKMALKKVKSQEAAFLTAQNKWEEGLISIMDFYESRNRLAQARGEALRTKLQLFIKERTIQFYLTGTLFELL